MLVALPRIEVVAVGAKCPGSHPEQERQYSSEAQQKTAALPTHITLPTVLLNTSALPPAKECRTRQPCPVCISCLQEVELSTYGAY